MFDQNNRETDQYLPVVVMVEDVNDNAPEFTGNRFFTVEERCRAGKNIVYVKSPKSNDRNKKSF